MSIYIPRHFNCDDLDQVEALIQEHPFATLITAQPEQPPMISHLPIIRYRDGKLYGHFARANPHAQLQGASTLVFNGPHAYISPAWMTSEGNVPTWNYAAVHLQGQLHYVDDGDFTWQILQQLTARYEGEEGWQLPDEPHFRKMLRALRVFEFQVESIEAKFKFSQNKSQDDRELIRQQLEDRGESSAAAMMTSR